MIDLNKIKEAVSDFEDQGTHYFSNLDQEKCDNIVTMFNAAELYLKLMQSDKYRIVPIKPNIIMLTNGLYGYKESLNKRDLLSLQYGLMVEAAPLYTGEDE